MTIHTSSLATIAGTTSTANEHASAATTIQLDSRTGDATRSGRRKRRSMPEATDRPQLLESPRDPRDSLIRWRECRRAGSRTTGSGTFRPSSSARIARRPVRSPPERRVVVVSSTGPTAFAPGPHGTCARGPSCSSLGDGVSRRWRPSWCSPLDTDDLIDASGSRTRSSSRRSAAVAR